MKLKFGSWTLTPYLMVVALVGLQACGSGGGSTPPADANANGYYTGTADVQTPSDDNTPYNIPDLQIMINGNRIMMMSDAKAVLYDGTFTVSGNNLTSTVSIYYNGNIQATAAGIATLNATITEGSQLTGTFTGTELGNGTFVSTFSNLSNIASDLTQVNNNYWLAGVNEFELRATSTLFDSTSDSSFSGCNIIAGSTFEPIANVSLFTVTFVFSTCDSPKMEGTYTGFSQAKTADDITVTMSNGTYAFADNFEKVLN